GRTSWRLEELYSLAVAMLCVHHPERRSLSRLRLTTRHRFLPWLTRRPPLCASCKRPWPCRTAIRADQYLPLHSRCTGVIRPIVHPSPSDLAGKWDDAERVAIRRVAEEWPNIVPLPDRDPG